MTTAIDETEMKVFHRAADSGDGGRLPRGPLAAAALLVAFLGGVGAAIVAGAGALSPAAEPLDSEEAAEQPEEPASAESDERKAS